MEIRPSNDSCPLTGRVKIPILECLHLRRKLPPITLRNASPLLSQNGCGALTTAFTKFGNIRRFFASGIDPGSSASKCPREPEQTLLTETGVVSQRSNCRAQIFRPSSKTSGWAGHIVSLLNAIAYREIVWRQPWSV